jgi:hypothetical protein
MSLFEEIGVRTIIQDDEIWINLKDISNHLLNAAMSLADEVRYEIQVFGASKQEIILLSGLTEGMLSAATLLAQGGVEEEINKKINTVEDLIKTLKDNQDGS